MAAEAISLDEAKKEKLFYFVATAVVYRESDGRCLILKRHDREKVHPGRYAVPGGKLEWKDLDITNPTKLNGDVLDFDGAVEDLLRRETKEEAGIELGNDFKYLTGGAFVRPDGIPVVLIKFGTKYKSGEVKLAESDFTDYAWVNAEEVKQYPCVDGITEEVAQTIALFQK